MNLKSYLTFLSRNKVYTIINLFGISVALMFVVLIGLYYEHETGINSHIPQQDRIGLIHKCDSTGIGYMTGTTREVAPRLIKALPQIESSCTLFALNNMHAQHADDITQKVSILFADSTYCHFFGIPLLEGDARTALVDLEGVILEEETARKLFPAGEAMGKPLKLNDKYRVTVRGIYRKTQNTSFPECNIIAPYELLREDFPYFFRIQGNFGSSDVFLKLKPETDWHSTSQEANRILQAIYREQPWNETDWFFKITPLKDVYFSGMSSNVCASGNSTMVNILGLIGLVILGFSIMNYINLTVAQSGRRAREMATRRLLGSQKHDIAGRLIMESMCMCTLAVGLAIILTVAAIPYTNLLLDTHISASQLLAPEKTLIVLAIIAILGLLCGVIPARVIAAVHPIDVVRGTFRMKNKTILSHVFMSLQHFITIILVALTCIIGHQTHYQIEADLGYHTDSLLCINIPHNTQKAKLFKQKLMGLPHVQKASVCMDTPLSIGFNNMGESTDGRQIRFQRLYGDQDYLDILGIHVVEQWQREANSLNPNFDTYVNASFHHMLGIPKEQRFFNFRPNDGMRMPLQGIVEDFRLGNITHDMNNEVIVVYIYKDIEKLDYLSNILIKPCGDKQEALKAVENAYMEVYHEEMNESTPWLEQEVEMGFEGIKRMSQIIGLFAAVGLIISILGLLAMSTYHIQQSEKEIAIRKVFGSSVAQVRRRLVKHFLQHVLLAAIPAVPLTVWLTAEYMSTQTHRIVWWPWILFAVLAVLVISWATVALQSSRAAAQKPVKHLKDNE